MDQAQLLAKISDLKHRAKQHDGRPHLRPPFDHQLFFTQSEKLLPYVEELEHSYQQVCQGKDNQRREFFAERFVNQLQAMQRVIDTITANEQNHSTALLEELKADLVQHQEWERKLCQLVRSKEQALQTQHHESQNQALVAQQRLNRCRQAICKIKQSIAQREGFVRGQQKY